MNMKCNTLFPAGEWRLASSRSRVKRRQELQRRGPAFRLRRVLAFAAPACCDAVATTLLNIGLFYTCVLLGCGRGNGFRRGGKGVE